MIGDPKDSSERTLNDTATVKDWIERVRRQVEPFVSFEGANAATIVNNYDWTENLSTIDFLRDIGKHFPVNRMLARDVVRTRLESGISYTEFSYVLLQSMDYLTLFRDHGVTLQFGGSDQWGNLTGGVELIRRADGGQGARVRDAAGHQGRRHEVRQDRGRRALARPGDDVAVRLLPVLAQRRGREGRRAAPDLHVPDPRGDRGARGASTPRSRSSAQGQRTLAEHVTTLVHGAETTGRIEAASEALFSGGSLADADTEVLSQALATARPLVTGAAGKSVTDLFVEAGLVQSRSEARRAVAEGGAYLNNERVDDPDYVPTADDFLGGECLVLRRGKKSFAGVAAP